MKLVIKDVPKSPNRVLGHHWSVKAGEKDKWVLLIRSAFLPSGACREKVRVAITVWNTVARDSDNLHASVKPVLDALKHWHLVRDDSPEWIDLDVQQELCSRKDKRTEIEIAPL